MNLKDLVTQRMADFGIVQDDLGKRLGMSQVAARKIAVGITKQPRNLPQLAKGLEVSMDVIYAALNGSLTKEQLINDIESHNQEYQIPSKLPLKTQQAIDCLINPPTGMTDIVDHLRESLRLIWSKGKAQSTKTSHPWRNNNHSSSDK